MVTDPWISEGFAIATSRSRPDPDTTREKVHRTATTQLDKSIHNQEIQLGGPHWPLWVEHRRTTCDIRSLSPGTVVEQQHLARPNVLLGTLELSDIAELCQNSLPRRWRSRAIAEGRPCEPDLCVMGGSSVGLLIADVDDRR